LPKVLIFSKELLRRKDYVINTRDCGQFLNSGADYIINVNPLVSYFPSQLKELVDAIKEESASYFRHASLEGVFKKTLLMFNEVIFANTIGWIENKPCFTTVTFRDKEINRSNRSVQRITKIFEKTKSDFNNQNLQQHLRFISILHENAETVLPPCQSSEESTYPIYHNRQLHVNCGLPPSPACISMNNILNQNPSSWTESLRIINNPTALPVQPASDIEKQMIESARNYRAQYYAAFLEDEESY
jgi:hypothetical protein